MSLSQAKMLPCRSPSPRENGSPRRRRLASGSRNSRCLRLVVPLPIPKGNPSHLHHMQTKKTPTLGLVRRSRSRCDRCHRHQGINGHLSPPCKRAYLASNTSPQMQQECFPLLLPVSFPASLGQRPLPALAAVPSLTRWGSSLHASVVSNAMASCPPGMSTPAIPKAPTTLPHVPAQCLHRDW